MMESSAWLYNGNDLKVYTEAKVFERVSAAVTYLTEYYEGDTRWAERIKLDKLDIGSLVYCVLGQLFGGYIKGLEAIDPPGYASELDSVNAGFTWFGMEDKLVVPLLNEEWSRQIFAIRVERSRKLREAMALHPSNQDEVMADCS